MLGSYTIIEILLSVAVLILAWHELRALLEARRLGKTQNKSRVVTLSTIIGLVMVYAIVSWFYLPYEGDGPIEAFGTPTVPWAYLLLGGLLSVVTAFEAVSIFRARAIGLTKNVSRLVSYSVMFVILLAMLGLAVRKWEHYLGRLDQTISQQASSE